MNDLISRQAAIDAVKRLSLGETDATRLAMRIGDYLERLQSAQPEPIKVYIDHELTREEYKKLREDVANAPIMLLPAAQPEQRWTPCSERLPEWGQEVLCCDIRKNMLVSAYVSEHPFDSDTGYIAESDECLMFDCVAWMPLPEPYKGGGQDEQIH